MNHDNVIITADAELREASITRIFRNGFAQFLYLWTGHRVLKVVRHVGRVAMHRHVHGHVDTHAGEHVVVLGGWLDSSCSTAAEHSALVLRPRAVLRGAVASTG